MTENMNAHAPPSIDAGSNTAVTAIDFGIASGLFGDCLIATTPHGICHFTFTNGNIQSAIDELHAAWPLALLERDDSHACILMNQALTDPSTIRLHVHGTPFQLDVWNALLKVPHGTTTTYQELAATAGHPAATRATGTAIGKNPIALLIPCHRVIRKDGSIGGYRWGTQRKRDILNWETSHPLQSSISPRPLGFV